MSKAALNQFIKTLSIELGHSGKIKSSMLKGKRQVSCVALHPGTVDTELSKPFHGGIPQKQIITPEQSAEGLLNVLDNFSREKNGSFYSFDGSELPW